MTILTNLTRNDFEDILSNYSIGNYISHKHIERALGNTIYLVKTSNNKFIMKIFENSDPRFIDYQINLTDIAENNKLPVPKNIITKTGKKLLLYKDKRIIVQEFIIGRHPKKLSNILIIDIANKQARLNKALFKAKLKNIYNWGGDYHFSLMAFNVKKFEDFNIRKEEQKILSKLKHIDKSQLRKSAVHGDFHSVNLLVKNDRLNAILDWDDAHEDYFIHDLSCFIAHSFIKPNLAYQNQIRLYLREYQKVLPLNIEEKKAIYYFIKQRYLGGICWQIKQTKNHKNMKKIIFKHIRNEIKRYKLFDKISLEKFLKLS